MCEEVKLLLAWKDKLAIGPWGEWCYRPGRSEEHTSELQSQR